MVVKQIIHYKIVNGKNKKNPYNYLCRQDGKPKWKKLAKGIKDVTCKNCLVIMKNKGIK